MASTGWKVVRPHVVMIAFRAGGHNKGQEVKTGSSPSALPKSATGATGPNVTQLPIIEDFQLPLRYRRRPLGEKEIAYINRGGPE